MIIDGNNLIFAMQQHAPVGRETMVRIIASWARRGHERVSLIFDGPPPREGLSAQMTSSRITVRFSAPATADDLIVDAIHRARHPHDVRVVSGDTAILKEASRRRAHSTSPIDVISELFPSSRDGAPGPPRPRHEKPDHGAAGEARVLMELLGEEGSGAPVPGEER